MAWRFSVESLYMLELFSRIVWVQLQRTATETIYSLACIFMVIFGCMLCFLNHSLSWGWWSIQNLPDELVILLYWNFYVVVFGRHIAEALLTFPRQLPDNLQTLSIQYPESFQTFSRHPSDSPQTSSRQTADILQTFCRLIQASTSSIKISSRQLFTSFWLPPFSRQLPETIQQL